MKRKTATRVVKCRCGEKPDVYIGEYELWVVRHNGQHPFHCFEVWDGNKARAIRAWNKLNLPEKKVLPVVKRSSKTNKEGR